MVARSFNLITQWQLQAQVERVWALLTAVED